VRLQLEQRKKTLVNIDGKRRCYNGCFAGWEWQWSDWDWLEWSVLPEHVETRLKFWRELNEYAVSQRGKEAKKEFRIVKIEE
jgi:hypothetical protein